MTKTTRNVGFIWVFSPAEIRVRKPELTAAEERVFSRDPRSEVRKTLAERPNLQASTSMTLLSDEDPNVVIAAIRNQSTQLNLLQHAKTKTPEAQQALDEEVANSFAKLMRYL